MTDHMNIVLQFVEATRIENGFLTLDSMIRTVGARNTILDPWSTLISSTVEIGRGNVFFPNTVVAERSGGRVCIGDDNVLHSNTSFIADGGSIAVGSGNQFGEGGVWAKANVLDAAIVCGDRGRYLNGVQILGRTQLGDGCQVIGAITVQDCILEGGGDYQSPDPDQRGAVLKGFGLARQLRLRRGDVINGSGQFSEAAAERQASYHQVRR